MTSFLREFEEFFKRKLPGKHFVYNFWEVLQVFLACVSPRTNEGVRTVGIMTDVLEVFDQRAYLNIVLHRIASEIL